MASQMPKALSMETRVLQIGERSVQMVTAGIPGDSFGVESISSRPSTPRSQKVSTCRWRSEVDQKWLETKDVYPVFNRRRTKPLSSAASYPLPKSGATTPIRYVRLLPSERAK